MNIAVYCSQITEQVGDYTFQAGIFPDPPFEEIPDIPYWQLCGICSIVSSHSFLRYTVLEFVNIVKHSFHNIYKE